MLGKSSVIYFRDMGRTTLPNGKYVTTYAPGIVIDSGQVQPIPRSQYQQLGLDVSKKYVTWYVPLLDVRDIARDASADQFVFAGERYQVENNNDWFDVDGWLGVVGIKIGNEP
jgi:hypothetical protein